MVARVAFALLITALVWTASRPATVALDPHDSPDAYADAMGIPEVFEPAVAMASLKIDPEPHRAGIERVEAILFRRSPADYGDAGAVESALARLADGVLRTDGFRGRQAGVDLLGLAGRIGARADSGYSLPSLVRFRREWQIVRNNVFRTADWMRTATPDLDGIQEPPAPPADPRSAEVLDEARRELARLLRRGRRDVERLGEPHYDPERTGPAVRRFSPQIRVWFDWSERWRGELFRAMRPVRELSPAPHPAREPLLADAMRSLREAESSLRDVPNGAGMWPTPFRGAWEARFETARIALEQARSVLAAEAGARQHAEAVR